MSIWKPHRWCTDKHARLKCGISWVQTPVGSLDTSVNKITFWFYKQFNLSIWSSQVNVSNGVLISMLASSAEYCGFKPQFGHWIPNNLILQTISFVNLDITSQTTSVVYWLACSPQVWNIVGSSSQTEDYKICNCCFSAKHAALMSWLGIRIMHQEWNNMSIHRLLFQ